jgi:hypothetical protein
MMCTRFSNSWFRSCNGLWYQFTHCRFIYAMTGTTTAYIYELKPQKTGRWILVVNRICFTAFIPIVFELMVVCCGSMSWRSVISGCWHRLWGRIISPAFNWWSVCNAHRGHWKQHRRSKSILQSAGAVEIFEKEAETGWWFGRYDKTKKAFEKKKSLQHKHIEMRSTQIVTIGLA